jgi:hypothetical protein
MRFRCLCQFCALTIAIAFVIGAPTMLLAGPLVAHPAGTHPPGFVTHLAPAAPAPLPPGGGTVGPIPFGDFLPNPFEPHHWEIELNNPAGIPASFNVTMSYPGGGFPLTGISLAPGASVYWDIVYSDIPPEVGAYTITATNPSPLAPLLTITTSVIEYPFAILLPGSGPTIVGGGAVLPDPILDEPPVFIEVVPEPATASMAIIGMAALALIKRRRTTTA